MEFKRRRLHAEAVDSKSPIWRAYHRTAVRAVFGDDCENSGEVAGEMVAGLGNDDVARLAVGLADQIRRTGAAELDRVSFVHELAAMISEFKLRTVEAMAQDLLAVDSKYRSEKLRREMLEDELDRLRRRTNEHVRQTLRAAVEEWKVVYANEKEHAKITVTQAKKAVENFLTSFDPDREKLLKDVRGSDIQTWTDALQGAEIENDAGEKSRNTLEPVTKKKYRAYLSSFFSWARRRYDLSENPVQGFGQIAGVKRSAHDIRAFTGYEDITAFLRLLSPHPYWRAWVAMAILAGLRYSEQAYLELDSVSLADGCIHVRSRSSGKRAPGMKTGRMRRVPIERTTLLPILRAHLLQRKKERANLQTPAMATAYVFPSTVPDNPYSPRRLTPAGVWSHNTTWARQWKKIVEKMTLKKLSRYADFGPDEWRHSFGTTLAHCRWSSLQIAEAMGNSEKIVQTYYVLPGSGGRVWPFEY